MPENLAQFVWKEKWGKSYKSNFVHGYLMVYLNAHWKQHDCKTRNKKM